MVQYNQVPNLTAAQSARCQLGRRPYSSRLFLEPPQSHHKEAAAAGFTFALRTLCNFVLEHRPTPELVLEHRSTPKSPSSIIIQINIVTDRHVTFVKTTTM